MNLTIEDFKDNKYTKWYMSIINNPDASGFTEEHHIIPKSLGGSNEGENLVHLSTRQHYIVHLLLPKMLSGVAKSKMVFALRCMTNFNKLKLRYKPSSKLVEYMKRLVRETPIADSHRTNIVKGQLGKKLSLEHRDAIRKGLLGRAHSDKTKKQISESNKGLTRSTETRKNISDAAKQRKSPSLETRQKISQKSKGRKAPKEVCMAIKKSQEKYSYTITSPDNETIVVSNLKDWCITKGFPYTSFSAVSRVGGRTRSGWTISRILTK